MKRILALSGGGVRGIVEIAFLEAVERVYRARRGPEARLSDVFDLVGGTSTGAIIAAAIALGKPVSEIASFYLDRASRIFVKPRWWQFGIVPLFDAGLLEAELTREVGTLTLGAPEIRTRLAIVMKRLDTGSPWIVSNIPTSPFYDDPEDGSYVGNRHYPLVRLLRASSAAPTFFRQQTLEIIAGEPAGVFVDGGASPYNDPSLALLMLARLEAHGLRWEPGPDNLFVLSIGCGRARNQIPPEAIARAMPLKIALLALRGLINDGEQHSLTMMEWLGQSRLPQRINSEVGEVGGEHAFGPPGFSYLRLDLPLEAVPLTALCEETGIPVPSADFLRAFRRIDDPAIIRPLYEITRAACESRYDLEALLP